MVVLEGHNMLGVNSPNQYLQPDYLSPLPTTLDAKKSPLALLVQTCSAIGADTPSKAIPHPSPLSSTDSNSSSMSSNSAGQKRKASTSSDSGHGTSLKSLSSDSSNDSRPRSSGSTTSCSSAKQPRLSHSTSPSAGHMMVNGKVSPPHHKYSSSSASNNNNNNIENPSKMRKLSGQSISSETSEKSRLPSRNSPPTSQSSSSGNVIVPHGKHSSGSSGSRSPHQNHTQSHHEKSSKSSENNSSSSSSKHNSSPKPASHQQDQGASPIIRSGLDVLQGKDLPKFGAFGAYPPPGFDPTNPAFRLPFLAAHHAHLLGYPGAPGAGAIPPGSPYASLYARSAGMKPGDGICKDPFCTGCQFSGPGGASASSNAFMAAALAAAGSGSGPSVCPAGCATCDHQKFPLMPPSAGPASGPYASIPGFPGGLNHAALSALSASGYPPSLLSHPHAAAAAAMMQQQQAASAIAMANAAAAQTKPYVCNWNADSYCGKRFGSSEELLQHLRTHTSAATASAENVSTSSAGLPNIPISSASASLYSSALLNSSAMAAAAAAMHRTYPTPPLSPHSAAAARFNPYAAGKPPGPIGPIPPPPSALAGYYSPYSLYGPRIG